MMNIDPEVFQQHLSSMNGMKISSCRRYARHVDEFLKFRADRAQNASVKEITTEDIEIYLDACWRRGNGNQVIRRKLSALQGFFRFLVFTRIVEKDPTAAVHRPESANDPAHRLTRNNVLFRRN